MLSFPNAKINIGLYITEKRPDGFHNLETVFFPIPWCDILEIVPSKKTELEITGLPVPGNPDENLVLKAYNLVKADYDIPPVKINLHKQIPMGAGLGGGSSDAVSCLLNLNKQFMLDISEEKLLEYALKIGSDCPFFLKNTAQFATGRGELMQDVDVQLLGKYLLVVFPGLHVSTKASFENINPKPAKFDLMHLSSISLNQWNEFVENDFETFAFHKFPRLKKIKSILQKNGAEFVLMSGSGSAVFAIFNEKPKIIKLNEPIVKLLNIS
ncbi:MAG: 4-(cytidine 5'-diphospho)-2-C-methyl-D-erythritol kinase [Bacteroidales bacterium]|jgi:4-diphosphocytidyl-2-C-methyl-D-erythritol kinase|nr:4-(cytidine 5'-diphospho)-2-C-methyl-D-erythritol kinase [Bacteroidales bacterium]